MNKFLKLDKTICILINKQGSVCYSNIDTAAARKYLEIVHFFDYLPIDADGVRLNVGCYNVTVDRIYLDKREYYLLLIQPHGNVYKYAYRDSFTGLYNRNYWEHLISGMLYCRISKKFTLIVIDVDNLKQLNDNKGHLAGDKAIWIVGQAIKQSIRKSDIGVRYGGDEFFILLANTRKTVVEKVINRIKENINKKAKRENIHIEISTGAACFDSTCDIKKIIAVADSKMYKEKAKKRARTKQITDELIELKGKIESVRGELKNKVINKLNGMIDKELMEVNMKLDEMIKNYPKNIRNTRQSHKSALALNGFKINEKNIPRRAHQ